MKILWAEVSLFSWKDPQVGTLDVLTQKIGISWECNNNSNNNNDDREGFLNIFTFQALC